jgi:predicted RNA-binding protein with PUA domain
VAEAQQTLQQAIIPFVFCFGCRQVIPERPCDACDAETELFQVTTETDRRLAVSRLSAEADRT